MSIPSLDKGKHAPEGLKGRTGGVLPLAGHKARLRGTALPSHPLRPSGVRRSFAGTQGVPGKVVDAALPA